jgi:CRISPR-associated protein Csb2
VIYLWRDLSISDDHLWGLKLRAARVGYLGCADSPVRLKVGTDDLASWESLPAWEPDDAGSKVLPVPSVGFLNQLDDAYERWCSGEQVRRAWLTTRFARYRAPGDSVPGVSPPTVLWLRFETPVAGRRVLAVTGALREAVLEGYERGVAGSRALVPPVLHGHGYEGRGFQHAHWLALPHVDSEHADGRIHGAAVWLPPETDGEVVEGVRQVLWHLSTQELAKPGHFRTKVKVFAGERQPWAANPKRWQGPARSWVSAFPVVHERWQAKGPDLDEVGNWCRHAGIATLPAKFRICRVPLAEGALLLSPHEVIRGERRHPYSHIEIVFAAEVIGPVVLGQGRQFGLGLMAPRMDGRLNG